MPYYQSINGRKYEYADEQPIVSKPIAPGKVPLFAAKDFGDIIGNSQVVLLKQHARILSRDNFISTEFGNALRQLLNNVKPGDLLQPVKIVRANANPRHPLYKTYGVVFDNGAVILNDYLEAVLNHPDMTIHEANGGNRHLALMVEGEVVGVIAGATYTPERADILWEAPQA